MNLPWNKRLFSDDPPDAALLEAFFDKSKTFTSYVDSGIDRLASFLSTQQNPETQA